MKKFLSVILCTLLTVSVAACGGSGKDSSKKKEKEYIKIPKSLLCSHLQTITKENM